LNEEFITDVATFLIILLFFWLERVILGNGTEIVALVLFIGNNFV